MRGGKPNETTKSVQTKIINATFKSNYYNHNKWDSLPNQTINSSIVFCPARCNCETCFCCLFWHRNFDNNPKCEHFCTKDALYLKIIFKKENSKHDLQSMTSRRLNFQHVKFQTLTFTSIRVRPSSLIVGNTLKGRLTPSVIRYLTETIILVDIANDVLVLGNKQQYTYYWNYKIVFKIADIASNVVIQSDKQQ